MILLDRLATFLLGIGIAVAIFVVALYLLFKRSAWELLEYDRGELPDGR